MAARAPPLRVALHPDQRVLAQPRRALVRRAHQRAAQARHAPLRPRPEHRHPRLDQDLERRPPPLRLDQDRRPDPRLHRPLLRTNQRLTTLGMPHEPGVRNIPPVRLKVASAHADKPSEMKPVNLLPTDLRSGATGPVSAASTGTTPAGGIGAYIVLGVLALCVVALAGYVLAGNVVKARKADLARMTAESAALSRQAAALKPYADFETLANARVQTVRD